MSFLEWRKFNFFDLKENIDNGKVAEVLNDTDLVAYSSGNGQIVLCDTTGFVHLIKRNWSINTFKGYEVKISLAFQLRQSPLLVTVGEDVPGTPLIKVWDTCKLDKNDTPICVRILRIPVLNGTPETLATAIWAQYNLLVIGLSNGTVWLRRGDLTRERGARQRTMRDVTAPITGLAIRTTSKQSYLYVSTTESVFLYNITVKDKEYKVSLDNIGCAHRCSVLAENLQECHFMIGKNEAVYCYTPDGRGPCYAIDGEKILLDWFRSYLVIVSQTSSGGYQITVLDIQNNFIVFNAPLQIKAVLNEWGGFYLIGKTNEVYHLDEKDLQSKLSLLFKKKLYDVSIRIAKSQQYDAASLIDLLRQYGDHLYSKGDHTGAVEQYIMTIGKLEPSYVIRKFIDSPQHIDKLTMYLQALHKKGEANEDHTTLLLSCYTKLDRWDKLKEFILTKDRDVDFDIDTAIRVCRNASFEDALFLAKKYSKHDWYLKIQIEDHQKYADALDYIGNLEFNDAEAYMKKYGKILVDHVPNESTQFLKRLCTDYKPANKIIINENMLDGGNIPNTDKCSPDDFIHLFLNNTEKAVEFLEFLISQTSKHSTRVYDTLIESYITLWNKGGDKSELENKLLELLQNPESLYDKNQALVVCATKGFHPGLLYLYEDAKLYQLILQHQMRSDCGGDMQAALACCRRYGHQEPTLWIDALWHCSRNAENNVAIQNIIPEILNVISKERLVSPMLVLNCLCSSSFVTLGMIRKYLMDALQTETDLIEKEQQTITQYKNDTQKLREYINQLKNGSIVFQGSRCAACHLQLELPAIHFLCQHSYHQHCFQSFSENEEDCPACQPTNKQLIDMIKSQQTNRDLHETFHNQLEQADDPFSVLAEYFGRNVFNKVTLLTNETVVQPQLGDVLGKLDYDFDLKPEIIDTSASTAPTYGPGAEARKRVQEGTKQGSIVEHQKPNQRFNKMSAAIPTTAEGRLRLNEQRKYDLQYSSSLEANMTQNFDTRPIPKSSSTISSNEDKTSKSGRNTNPFEADDDYNRTKNPFYDGDDDKMDTKDDYYNKNLNPFE